MNSVNLIGRLTKDVELRYTTNNVACASFTLAVNRNFKNQNGEYEADFINCTAFKNNAEFIQKYFSKGQMLGVTGSIRTRKWVDNDGNNKYATEVVVDNVTFTEGKKTNSYNSTQSDATEPGSNDNEIYPPDKPDTLPF